MRVVAVGGEPATGKSTVMRLVAEHLGPYHDARFGLVRFHSFEQVGVVLLGDYSDPSHKFSGTDRLSMAVQPDAQAFLQYLLKSDRVHTVLFEGDRLFNTSFLSYARNTLGLDLSVVVLDVDQDKLKARHVERGDTQTDSWLRGRRTKVKRVAQLFPDCTRYLPNDRPQDAQVNALFIAQLCQEGALQHAYTA